MLSTRFLERDALLKRVERMERGKARVFARDARLLAELAEEFDGAGDPHLVMELAGTARIGQVRAGGQTDRATRLVHDLPIALSLLETGEMYVGTADILLALSKNVSSPVRRELDRRVSARVATMDAVDARALVAATVVEVEAQLDRQEQERRFAQARADRGVWVKPVEDGMARIGAEVDAVAAKEFALGLEEIARVQKLADDRCGVQRTHAQRLADVLLDLPARYLALHQAQRSGRADALLAQGVEMLGAQTQTGSAPEELPLDLPPAEPPRAWDVDPDLLAAALLALPTRRPRVLNVHCAASTLLDLDDQACLIEGLGPLPGWMARTLLPDASLRRVLVDRRTGLPLHLSDTVLPPIEVDATHRRRPDDPPGPPPHRPRPDSDPPASTDTNSPSDVVLRERHRLSQLLCGPAFLPEAEPQYQPSTGLRRFVEVRDLRCTGPGCPRAATACDLDHELERAHGGPTVEWNLSAKSQRCHTARHHGWTADRDRSTGITTWTSPLQRVYLRLPAWRPPPPLPDDTVLGTPPPRTSPDVEAFYPNTLPLLHALTPKPAPAPKPVAPTRPDRGWGDGPPPF